MSRQTTATFNLRHDRLILDGLPRNIEQAKMLQSHASIERIIHLNGEGEAPLTERIRFFTVHTFLHTLGYAGAGFIQPVLIALCSTTMTA